MNVYKINIRIFVALIFLLTACDKEMLNKTPLNQYSDANVWSDINLASSYLNDCYNGAQIGQFKAVMIGAVSDEMLSGRGSSSSPYNVGNMTADNTSGQYGSNWYSNSNWNQFNNVQKINIFLDKIDKLPDAYKVSEKADIKKQADILKGEALFLRAFLYTEMCRTYGGLPILKKPNSLEDDFSTITRGTFKETVDFIAADCDAAAKLLPLKANTRLGKATKEAALAIKSRMLLFAASDLTADGTAKSELVGYLSPNRASLWTAARDAAKAVMDLGTSQLADFGAPDQKAVAQKYFDFFKAKDLSNPEVIWGIQYLLNLGRTTSVNQTNGPNGNFCFGRNGPVQGMVDEYEMEDGSKYSDHFTVDANKYIKNISTKYQKENPYLNREPRFYGSVLYDGAVWQPRLPALAGRDPLGIYDRRLLKTVGADGTVTNLPGLDTRQGPIAPQNGTYGGYLTKKFMDPAIQGTYSNTENVAIEIRYAEILFNYAEACLALNDIPTATTYINKIRNRAGLPNFIGDITMALRHERKVELYAEGFRWYDIRRWKIMPQVFVPSGVGIDVVETYNVSTTKRTTTWQHISAQVPNKWVESMYWIAIQTDELKKAPQLKQNPGY